MAEVDIRDEMVVRAPISTVWQAIKNPAVHAAWHPFVTSISGEHEQGAVRRCVIRIGKKDGHTEERCSACEHESKILWRIEKDSTGFSGMVSDWTAGFLLKPAANDTLVTASSVFRPRRWFVRLMLPFIRRKFHQTQIAILSGLKEHVEGRGGHR